MAIDETIHLELGIPMKTYARLMIIRSTKLKSNAVVSAVTKDRSVTE